MGFGAGFIVCVLGGWVGDVLVLLRVVPWGVVRVRG